MICEIVDTDDTTVLFDLHDVEDAALGESGCTVLSFDWGSVEPERQELSNAPYPGAAVVNSHDPNVDATLVVHVAGDDFDDLRSRVMDLQTLLERGGTIHWQPDASDERWIDFYPSGRAALLRGQEPAFQRQALAAAEGWDLEVRLRRPPYMRGATQTLVTNHTITYDDPFVQFTNPGNMPSECRITIRNNDADQSFVGVLIGRRTRGDLSDFASEAIIDSDSGEVNNDFWSRDWQGTITPVSGPDLDGTFGVIARVKINDQNTEGIGGYLRLQWGMSGASFPAGVRNPAVYIDASDLRDGVLDEDVAVHLGHVTFDQDAPALQLELWSSKVAVHWLDLTLIPADELHGSYGSPGVHSGLFAAYTWLPTDLNLEGDAEVSDDYNYVTLRAADDVTTTPKNLPEGEHIAHFVGQLEKPTTGRLGMVRFSLYKNGSEDQHIVVGSGPSSHRQVDYDDSETLRWLVTDTGDTYHVEALADFTDSPGRHVRVERITIGFIPLISDGRALVIDGVSRDAWIQNDTGGRVWQASIRGPFLEAEAGENLFLIRMLGLFSNGYDKVALDHGKLMRLHTTWDAAVTVELTPRYSQ